MQTPNNNKAKAASEKDFWNTLQAEILISNQKLTLDDVQILIEQNLLFSMFFRICSQIELINIQSLLHIKDHGYVMMLNLSSMDRSIIEKSSKKIYPIHHYIKKQLEHIDHVISPLIGSRIFILVSHDTNQTPQSLTDEKKNTRLSNYEAESLTLADRLILSLHNKFHLSVSIGIGSLTGIHSINSSFIEALTSLHYCKPNQKVHIKEIVKAGNGFHFDYAETEKHMIDAIRLRKLEAYDYFGMLLEQIRPMNDNAKRNRILEILVLATHAMRLDGQKEMKHYDYVGNLKEIMEYRGDQLIEWAYKQFVYITGYVKPQNSIDYSNKIVQSTKEYLEAHFTEDITLEDAAAQVNISPQYFSKLIKKTTGFNFIDWLSMMRVRKAKELLSNSNLTVKEVCYMVGYKDPNYFSRIFKKRVGITPSEYIKNNVSVKNKMN
ncbi:MAG: helix-turn-helix transcriptional regulator [Clostridiales bacterium]|nr:helix-turn-helix transcriptional regulator [Clostridiales bacterium]